MSLTQLWQHAQVEWRCKAPSEMFKAPGTDAVATPKNISYWCRFCKMGVRCFRKSKSSFATIDGPLGEFDLGIFSPKGVKSSEHRQRFWYITFFFFPSCWVAAYYLPSTSKTHKDCEQCISYFVFALSHDGTLYNGSINKYSVNSMYQLSWQ